MGSRVAILISVFAVVLFMLSKPLSALQFGLHIFPSSQSPLKNRRKIYPWVNKKCSILGLITLNPLVEQFVGKLSVPHNQGVPK